MSADGAAPRDMRPAGGSSGWSLFDTPVGRCALAWNAADAVTGCHLP